MEQQQQAGSARERELIERAVAVVCDVFGVTRDAVFTRRRSGMGWRAKATACLLLVEHGGLTFSQASVAFGTSYSGARYLVSGLESACLEVGKADLARLVDTSRKLFIAAAARSEGAAAA